MNTVADLGEGKRYFAEIPNIVFTLGLSPYELALYCHLKKTAGAEGECWKTTETLASETRMSAGMVSKAKISLQSPRPELGGKPLIVLRESPNPKGGKPLHHISVVDVWPENVSRFARPTSRDEVANSPHELASSYSEIASSPHELKKKPSEEEPMKKGGARVRRAAPSGFAVPSPVPADIGKHFTQAELEAETLKFLDYHRSKGNRFADWTAAWRNWMRNEIRYRNNKASPESDNGSHFKLTPEIVADMEQIPLEEAKRRLEC
jgi:Helix-turn-helix domain